MKPPQTLQNMVRSKKTKIISLTLAFLFCAAVQSASALQMYSFSQDGYSGGGNVAGTFSATDLNGDGQISSFNGEVSAYSMTFSGNNTVSGFSHSSSNLYGLVYDIGSGFIGDGWRGAVEGVASNWFGSTGYSYASGYGPTGQVGGRVINLTTGATSSTLNMVAVSENTRDLIRTLLRGSITPYVGSQWPVFRDQYQLTTFYPQIIVDRVGPNILSTGIGAKFSPNLGFSINEAAAALGYDHFNWMQWYGPTDPLTGRIADWRQAQQDPPLSCYQAFADLTGNPCPNVDSLSWYNDEHFSVDGTRIYDDNGNRVNNGLTRLEQWTVRPDTLLFSDAPTVNASFRTCLAGVRANGTGDIFFDSGEIQNDLCFDWQSSYDGTDIGLTQDVGGFAGANISFLGFSPEPGADELQAYARIGVGAVNLSSVPEPASLLLIIIGFGALGLFRVRATPTPGSGQRRQVLR